MTKSFASAKVLNICKITPNLVDRLVWKIFTQSSDQDHTNIPSYNLHPISVLVIEHRAVSQSKILKLPVLFGT